MKMKEIDMVLTIKSLKPTCTTKSQMLRVSFDNPL